MDRHELARQLRVALAGACLVLALGWFLAGSRATLHILLV